VDKSDRDERLLAERAPDFDGDAALARFRARIERDGVTPQRSWTDAVVARLALSRTTWLRPAVAAAALVLVVSAAAFTGLADTVLTVFEPKQVATVQVDPTQLRGIPDPSQYGTLTWIARPSPHPVADASAAGAEAGFTPLTPASLPASVPTLPRFAVINESKATFQFDEAKAIAAAAKVNATIPPMPAAIKATTLTLTGGPAIIQQYGGTATTTYSGDPTLGGSRLIIVQSRAPLVTSNGATVQELRDYALAQPGIPPSVAAQIRAIGDPISTLLVPIGADLQNARAVTVRGTQGYLVGDQTGLGSAVFWLERGFVFAALGPLTESDLLTLVNALR
jgi:hypothetical protein